MGFLYSEVAEYSMMDYDVLANIPKTCDGLYGCGSELEFTDNLTQIYCPNRFCTHKVASRLEAMAKEMKADGWGLETCLKVVKLFGLKSPAQVFLIPSVNEEMLSLASSNIAAFDKKLQSICDPEKRKVQLWQVVKLMNIPGLAMNAMKVFDGYTSMTEAYKDIEERQVPLIMERLGISKNTESSVMAINIYATLIDYKDELISAEKRFYIYTPEGEHLKMAITGGVDGYTNKSEFIKYLNLIGKGKFSISLMNTVSTQVDILVADNDTSSKKFKTACKINEKAGYDRVKIFDGDMCIAYLKRTYNIE